MRAIALVGSFLLLTGVWVKAAEGDQRSIQAVSGQGMHLRGRLALAFSTPGPRTGFREGAYLNESRVARLSSLSLMGDYYFEPAPSVGGNLTGIRATSGLVIGPRLRHWRGATTGSLGNGLFSVELHALGALVQDEANSETSAMPYLGIGYAGAHDETGLSFSADLGLTARNPGSAVRLGRVLSGDQSLEDVLRALRLSPVLQFGVSYSF